MCSYCESLVEGKSYRVDGDGYCHICQEKVYSDGCNVIYTGLLRGFHRFKTIGMGVCGACGTGLEEMTLPCSEFCFRKEKIIELEEGI